MRDVKNYKEKGIIIRKFKERGASALLLPLAPRAREKSPLSLPIPRMSLKLDRIG